MAYASTFQLLSRLCRVDDVAAFPAVPPIKVRTLRGRLLVTAAPQDDVIASLTTLAKSIEKSLLAFW
jgi:hypothetical protein